MTDSNTKTEWAPWFNVHDNFRLPDETKAQIRRLLGENADTLVEQLCQEFLGLRENLQNAPTTKENREMLTDLNSYAAEIQKISAKMGKIKENWSVSLKLDSHLSNATHIPAGQRLRGNSEYFKNLSEDMAFLKKITDYYTKPKVGRPKGTKERPLYFLIKKLHLICQKNGITVTRINRNGIEDGVLHQLINILKKPLRLDRNYPGLINKIIINFQEHPPESICETL